jgi:hypothetical protein
MTSPYRQVVLVSDIDRIIDELQIEEARALRREVLKSNGKPMKIEFDFALGRLGGIRYAIDLLRELKSI